MIHTTARRAIHVLSDGWQGGRRESLSGGSKDEESSMHSMLAQSNLVAQHSKGFLKKNSFIFPRLLCGMLKVL